MDDDEWRKIDRCIHGYFQYDQCEYCHAPKREWVGLTDEEVQFYRKKHSKLFNAGYDKVTETNLIAEEFDSIGFYKEVSAALKERNT